MNILCAMVGQICYFLQNYIELRPSTSYLLKSSLRFHINFNGSIQQLFIKPFIQVISSPKDLCKKYCYKILCIIKPTTNPCNQNQQIFATLKGHYSFILSSVVAFYSFIKFQIHGTYTFHILHSKIKLYARNGRSKSYRWQ